MIPTVRRRDPDALTAAIDLAPLIDVVFILLIFFLVTTSFNQEAGIAIERPRASYAEGMTGSSLRLSMTAAGAVYSEGQRLGLDAVRERVRRFVAEHPSGSVVLIPDRRTPAEALVRLMDAAKAGGAERLAVATLRANGGGDGP